MQIPNFLILHLIILPQSKYSETYLSWPPTVPETVVNVSKWSAYTNVSQNNFQPYSYFISCLIYSQSATSAVLNLYSI